MPTGNRRLTLKDGAGNRLHPPGTLPTYDEVASGLEPSGIQYYFLLGVDACVSRLREVEWYVEALDRLGFSDVSVVPGTFDVVVAVRR